MKTLLATFLLAATGFSIAEITVPAASEMQRFTETLAKSPFILETKVTAEAPVVDKGSFCKDLYLRGVGKADGKDFVLVGRIGEERAMRFFGNEQGEDSIVVKSVKIGASFHDTKVILEKGSESGEVGFKEESISAPPTAVQIRPQAAPPQFGNPVRPPAPGANIKSGQPNQGVPRPQFTPSIQLPKPQGGVNVAPGNKFGTPPRQTDPNRRIRTPIISN